MVKNAVKDWNINVMYMIYCNTYICFCIICYLIEMSWDYFVHVCHGPPLFAIFDFIVYCLFSHFFVCIWCFVLQCLVFYIFLCFFNVVYVFLPWVTDGYCFLLCIIILISFLNIGIALVLFVYWNCTISLLNLMFWWVSIVILCLFMHVLYVYLYVLRLLSGFCGKRSYFFGEDRLATVDKGSDAKCWSVLG